MSKINGHSKIVADAAVENRVNQVVKNVIAHLDQKKLTCPNETKKEIHNFLTNSGLKKVSVRKTDWLNQRESDFYMDFSIDGTVVDSKKITRTHLNYPEPATA